MVDVSEAIQNRSSVRSFKEVAIEEPLKRRILEAALRAPNAGGGEQWLFVAVESEGVRRELHRLILDSHREYFTRMLLKPWTEERFEYWVKSRGDRYYFAPFYVATFVDLSERLYRDARIEELWAHQSCAAAIQNMILAAYGMGIGACWFGVPLLREDSVKEILGLSKPNLRLAGVVGFGYPQEQPKPRPRRKGFGEVVIVR